MPQTAPRNTGPDLIASTGHHSPESGWWRPDGDPKPWRYIQKGELMPSIDGEPTHWILVLELAPE